MEASHFIHVLCTHADIDECTVGTDKCDQNADCKDTVGSYTCTCKPGFEGDGKTCTSELDSRNVCDNISPSSKTFAAHNYYPF